MVVASYTCTGLYKTIPAVAGRSSGVAHATCMPARGLISPSGVPGDAGHVIPLAPPPLSMRLRCSDAACSVFRRGGNDMTSRGVLEFLSRMQSVVCAIVARQSWSFHSVRNFLLLPAGAIHAQCVAHVSFLMCFMWCFVCVVVRVFCVVRVVLLLAVDFRRLMRRAVLPRYRRCHVQRCGLVVVHASSSSLSDAMLYSFPSFA
jgi:hypothetical protein